METEIKKRRGRPTGYRSTNPADKTLPKVRVTLDQLDSYKNCADTSGKSLSAWIRDKLDDAVNISRS